MNAQAIHHYLSNYAEPESEHYASQLTKTYEHALVIPMFNEEVDCLAKVLRFNTKHSCLVIAVVNAPSNASCEDTRRTQKLLAFVGEHCPLDILVVDRVTVPIPDKQGVGLARKIGTDIATSLFMQGRLTSPWIRHTDADAQLPEAYFDAALPSSGAAVFSHQHHSNDQQLQQAADLYDQHMRRYVAGLRAAGSKYAFPTLGSTLAIHVRAYAEVRGFPKRSAAEDFYLLNKVAKVDSVTHIEAPLIQLAARASERVPFGTGPALQNILQGLVTDPSGHSYLSYHPKSFELLKEALTLLAHIAYNQAPPKSHALQILNELGLAKIETALATQNQSPAQRQKHLHDWFDAGKTLRFIHLARRHYADVSLLGTC